MPIYTAEIIQILSKIDSILFFVFCEKFQGFSCLIKEKRCRFSMKMSYRVFEFLTSFWERILFPLATSFSQNTLEKGKEAAHSLAKRINIFIYLHFKELVSNFRYYESFDVLMSSLNNFRHEYLQPLNAPASEAFCEKLQQKLDDRTFIGRKLSSGDICATCHEPLSANSNLAHFDCCDHLVCANCALNILIRAGCFDAQFFKAQCPYCRQLIGQWTTTELYQYYEKKNKSLLKFNSNMSICDDPPSYEARFSSLTHLLNIEQEFLQMSKKDVYKCKKAIVRKTMHVFEMLHTSNSASSQALQCCYQRIMLHLYSINQNFTDILKTLKAKQGESGAVPSRSSRPRRLRARHNPIARPSTQHRQPYTADTDEQVLCIPTSVITLSSSATSEPEHISSSPAADDFIHGARAGHLCYIPQDLNCQCEHFRKQPEATTFDVVFPHPCILRATKLLGRQNGSTLSEEAPSFKICKIIHILCVLEGLYFHACRRLSCLINS